MLMKMSSRRTHGRNAGRGRGFTLIELMIVIVVVAIGAALAAPSFRETIANYRVRGGAESIVNGLNYARAEAVRRNGSVTFTLNASGSGWSVDQIAPTAQAIQTRPDADSPGVTAASSTASRVATFLPTGMVDSTGVRLSRVTVSSSVAGTESRQIDILGGGLIRMCDPTVAVANDPRRC